SLAELRNPFLADADAPIEPAGRVTEAAMVSGDYSGQKFELPAVVPLFQAYNHGVEHRTDITSILNAHGYELPGL
ncbi:MAG TPA: hypothetical protein PJ994_05235, partial [Tepidiformaceae bacterium]|nr:hypothetical protein [Tepidiformaceae bacterium]